MISFTFYCPIKIKFIKKSTSRTHKNKPSSVDCLKKLSEGNQVELSTPDIISEFPSRPQIKSTNNSFNIVPKTLGCVYPRFHLPHFMTFKIDTTENVKQKAKSQWADLESRWKRREKCSTFDSEMFHLVVRSGECLGWSSFPFIVPLWTVGVHLRFHSHEVL